MMNRVNHFKGRMNKLVLNKGEMVNEGRKRKRINQREKFKSKIQIFIQIDMH